MAKYTGPKCKICRREMTPLMLKGQRCLTDKCPLKGKKKYPPGPPKKRRTKMSDYAIQLREKQKLRKSYGVLEKQFSSWGSENPHSHNCVDTGNHLYMDYLMHHRVALAAEIVKSMANGRQLSKSSEKVLKSSIEYIEQRL